jgi:hypothetical protein
LVKGMTRRIVEIKETGSSYFERAIFFVRMDMPAGTPENTLTKEASKIIDKFCSDLKLNKMPRRSKYLDIAKISIAAVGGAAAAVLVLELCSML